MSKKSLYPLSLGLVIGMGILLAIILSFYFLEQQETAASLTDTAKGRIGIQSSPSPSPFPFQELTIPYLRTHSYQSQLGEREEVITTDSYTGYLTTYDSDSLQIQGLLTIPTGETPPEGWPAVVFVHGYIPPASYRTLENYESYVDYLAERGIVVFKIDLRGHGSSEGIASGAYYSGDYVIDVLNAYSALESVDEVNPKQIGLWGHSMAGNVVMRAMAAQPTIPKVVIWAGAVYSYEDFAEFRIDDDSYRPPPQESQRQRERERLMETHGSFDPSSEFWRQVPATNYLDEIEGALQIHHAVNDDVVDIGYSRNLIEMLNETDIPHQLYEYQTGGHNITGAAFNQAMERTAQFLKQ